jgi:serine/threonine protein kinase
MTSTFRAKAAVGTHATPELTFFADLTHVAARHIFRPNESQRRKMSTSLEDVWGTPQYFAPELIDGAYGSQVDMWALGAMLYGARRQSFHSMRLFSGGGGGAGWVVQYRHTINIVANNPNLVPRVAAWGHRAA